MCEQMYLEIFGKVWKVLTFSAILWIINLDLPQQVFGNDPVCIFCDHKSRVLIKLRKKKLFKLSSMKHFFGKKKRLRNFKSIWFDKVPLHFRPLSFREFIWESHLSIETQRKHKRLAWPMTDSPRSNSTFIFRCNFLLNSFFEYFSGSCNWICNNNS